MEEKEVKKSAIGKTLRMIEVVQQIEYLCPEWKEHIKLAFDVRGCFKEFATAIDEYAWILHDKDISIETGELVKAHIHLMLKFKYPYNKATLLNWLNYFFAIHPKEPVIFEQNLSRVKKWASAFAYLTHENNPEKYHYSCDEVVTNIQPEIREQLIKQSISPINRCLGAIETGECRMCNLFDFVSKEEYSKYKRLIMDSFEYVALKRSKQKDRHMQVFYITGPAGIGKTLSAKTLSVTFGCRFSPYISSSSNDPLCDYKGEDSIILDDLRPDTWEFSDLLKFLDNNTLSSVKSRFYNKDIFFCKYLFITSTLDWYSFVKRCKNQFKEDINQFRRRLTYYVKIDSDWINVESFATNKSYRMVNPVKALERQREERLRQEEDFFHKAGMDIVGSDGVPSLPF